MRSLHLGVSFGLVATFTMVVSGCGGGGADGPADTTLTPATTSLESSAVIPSATTSDSAAAVPSAPPATTSPVTPVSSTGSTGRVVVVQMLGDATGYRFAPATVSVKPGDRVRWTMVSGAPHNVSFWPDSIPAGAATRLGANMPKAISPLTGPLMMVANESYEVSFDGLPRGTYRYFCTPHLALGMKAVVRVE